MGEPLEWPLVEEEVAGVAPELVEEALGGIAKKLAGEVGKVRALIAEIRRSMEFKKGLFRFGTAAPVEDLCYVAVDSSFTNPAVELVGGYLGVVKVVVVHYGSRCGGGSVEAKAYPGLWFNADLTSSVARYYEKRTGVELLERKKHGKADFDVLLLDGDLIPRSLSSRGSVGELHQKIADYTSKIIELADSTDTAVVGVLKRSYSRDLVSIMGFSDLRLSDKAVMSLILKPSEYVVAGSHPEIYGELKKLRGKPGVPGDWLEARLRWY
ncbi:MAG: DNA double-strand break repair nuclease NurA, partial [Thermosphaera sp.]